MVGGGIDGLGNAVLDLASAIQDLGNDYYASNPAWEEFPSQVEVLRDKHSKLAASQLERCGQDVGPVLQEVEKLMRKEVKTLEKRRDREEAGNCCELNLCGLKLLVTRSVGEIAAFPKSIGYAIGEVIRAYDGIVDQQELEETLRLGWSLKDRACLSSDASFGNPGAVRIGHSPDISKKAAIEPITLQLALSDSTWTEELYQSASQVCQEFLCNDLLCHHHLSRLLQNSAWVIPTLKFLENASLLDKSFWEKNTIQGILPQFESILADSQHPEFQIEAAWTLGRLVSHKANWDNILGSKGVLHQLVNLMSQAQNADAQCSGAEFFIACSHSHNDSGSLRKLVLFPPLLPVLVQSLANDRNAHLQRQVVLTLQNFAIAADTPTRRRILDSPLLLATLVASLAKPGLQWDAAWAIANLAGGSADKGARERMANCPMLLQNLESCLDQHENPNLKVQASRALINLEWTKDALKLLQILAVSLEGRHDPLLQEGAAAGLVDLARWDDANRDRILNFPGLLGSLVKSLDDDANSGLQTDAATALLNLAFTLDARIKLRIVSFPPMLGSLVSSLRKCRNPCLQYKAAWAIANLAAAGADQATRKRIVSFPGLLDNLEISLDQDDNPSLRLRAARALINLAWTKDTPKLLRILAVSLEGKQDPGLREAAAIGLAYLADGDNTIRERILSFPGLIENLVQSLDEDVNCGLRVRAASALIKLAKTEDIAKLLRIIVASLEGDQDSPVREEAAGLVEDLAREGEAVKDRILSCSGLLEKLVKALVDDVSCGLQSQAARALVILACTEDSAKLRILSSAVLLESLVASLRKCHNSDLQYYAARVIVNLALVKDKATRNEISNFPGLVESLEMFLDQDDNPTLRLGVTRALINLAWTKDTPKLLRILAVSLEQKQDPALQEAAAGGLAGLAQGDDVIEEQILSFPELLENLVQSLADDENCGLQTEAARALVNLTCTKDDARLRILSFPWILGSLTASLRKSGNPTLQSNAAWAIANLAIADEDKARIEQIASFPGLLDNLETSLDQDDNPNLRVRATTALMNLGRPPKDISKLLRTFTALLEGKQDRVLQEAAASGVAELARGEDVIIEQVLSFPSLLERLVRPLDDDANCGVQTEAARALVNLACATNTSIKVRTLMISPLVLGSVVASLGKRHNPELQSFAAWTVGNLAAAGEDEEATRKKLADFPGLLDNLEACLDRDDNPDLRVRAAKALINLAWTKDTGKLLRALAMSLENKQDPLLQERAAGGLSDLACGNDTIREQIVSFPGLVENLAQALDDDANCGLQTQAARSIVNLACALDTSVKARILSSPSLLGSLVAALNKEQNPTLQSYAVWAIGNFAGAGNDQAQIASFPGLLDNLETSLDHDDNPSLRVRAARALVNLAWTKDIPKLLRILAVSLEGKQDPVLQEAAAGGLTDLARGEDAIKDQILSFPGLLESLLKSVDDDVNCGLQTEAARALGNVACATDASLEVRTSTFPLLLGTLVAALRKCRSPMLQCSAATAIANWAAFMGADGAMSEQIARFPELLESLVKLLDDDSNPDLQKEAANVLLNLADAEHTPTKARMLSCPALLGSLVAALRKCQSPGLQLCATWAVANLAGEGADQAAKEQIASFPGLLGILESFVDLGDDANLGVRAARALVNLSPTKDSSRLLQILAVSLEKEEDPSTQTEAVAGLGDLAREGDDEIKDRLLCFPGLLGNLVKALDNDTNNGQLQKYAARVLLHLASSRDASIKVKVLDSPLLLRSLVAALGKPQNPDLQWSAASAIANFAGAGVEFGQKLVNCPGLVDALVKLLDSDETSCLRSKAALSLSKLPHSLGPITVAKIASLQ